MALKALIFDVDGTIAETEELHRRAFNQAFTDSDLGWEWSVDTYRNLLRVTGGKERIRHYLKTMAKEASNEFSDADIAGLHARKTALYVNIMKDSPPLLRPGVRRLMDEAIAAGIKIALATTTSRANADQLLISAFDRAISEHIQIRICGEDVAIKKPDPQVFALALKVLGISADEAIAFEDSSAGLASAKGAGIATIVAPSIYTSHHNFEGAMAVLSDLGEPTAPYQHIDGLGGDGKYVSADILAAWLDRTNLAS